MTEIFNDTQILGDSDTVQLIVQANDPQTQPLQVWQDSGGTALAQLTAEGALQLGNTFSGAADALIQASYSPTTAQPTSVWHTPGTVERSETIADPTNWVFHELYLAGTAGVSGLHNALYSKLTHLNTGSASTADLRAATFQAINLTGAAEAPVGQMAGLRATASNAGSAFLDTAVGVDAVISNDTAGSINTAVAFRVVAPVNAGTIDSLYGLLIPDLTQGAANYALYTGQGPVHFGDNLELKVLGTSPVSDPPSQFIQLYPKMVSDVPHLFAKDAAGSEYDLSGGASSSGYLMQNTLISSDVTLPDTYQYIVYDHLEVADGVNFRVNGEVVIL